MKIGECSGTMSFCVAPDSHRRPGVARRHADEGEPAGAPAGRDGRANVVELRRPGRPGRGAGPLPRACASVDEHIVKALTPRPAALDGHGAPGILSP